ncbi:uncharacterized protein FOMMEDRAFT_164379 [Fomitiporia mediterranea MF3/22]|uniref:uncharacterized protein n=1 Tax=Fomitiporia mediterranea (strain MF3/22) TaxID=694068 RepID=UPI0004409363|nr:uncharacterized protein FOMMEDRAFT_164379 [Fomitiporia mediterranea MF3/22]EJD07404.1 hypothetical protein FOMMEDRAFT_164379 [Fomitiporia mediterranea MF3/22]
MVVFTITTFTSLLAGASAVLAGPLTPNKRGNCDVSSASPDLPSGQTNVTVPSGQTAQKIALGVGVQNYTCNAGVYVSAGAVANLYDVSCLHDSSQFSQLPTIAYDIWNGEPSNDPNTFCIQQIESRFHAQIDVYAQHYFQPNPSGSGISPVFDARATSQKGDPNAYVLVSKSGDLAAPTGKQDVDWLELTAVQGDLAKTVLRIDTKYGQPPASCDAGSPPLSVKYAASYWFYA